MRPRARSHLRRKRAHRVNRGSPARRAKRANLVRRVNSPSHRSRNTAPAAPEATHVATASLFDEIPVMSTPAPIKAAPAVRTPPPQPLPVVALTLPPDSGLELVETRFNAPTSIEATPEPARPKRVRPPRVVIASEPLEIIETTKGSVPPVN